MKIIIATDSYKGSLSSMEAAEAMREGLMRVWRDAEYVCVPVADGGEGTASVMAEGNGGRMISETVTGPDGAPAQAAYALLPDGGAVIEMAAASGLPLMRGKLDAMNATTYGVGQLMRAALDRGVRRVYIGLGGSATNDGGAGFMQAMGARLLDAQGLELPRGGGALGRLASIDLTGMDARLKQIEVRLMSDVDSPLCGPRGASAIFGPQKGASPEQIAVLDLNLSHFARIVEAAFNRRAMDIPGAGAAGGLGFGLLVATDAVIRPGIEEVLSVCGFDDKAQGACLAVTGEGRMDAQSAQGKTPVGVARRARRLGIPTIAIVGSIGPGVNAVYDEGIGAIFSAVTSPMDVEQALANAREYVADAAERAACALGVWGRK